MFRCNGSHRVGDTPAEALKQRLRGDLKAALTKRDAATAATLRTVIAAIDNAEAPPLAERSISAETAAAAAPRSAEIERLLLSRADLAHILEAEIAERESAAIEMEKLGRSDRAAALRDEALLARRYLGAQE